MGIRGDLTAIGLYRIYVMEDGKTWTFQPPDVVYVTQDQIDVLQGGDGGDGDGAEDLLESLLEEAISVEDM